MSAQDYEQLTLFQEDSPASRSVKPGSAEARKMTGISGRKCSELLPKSGPLGSLAKMCLASSIWHSTRCCLTWKASATPRYRLLFQLVALTPRTEDTASQFWPTPSTGAGLCGGTGNFKTLQRMAKKGLITEEERRQFSQGNGGKTNPGLLEWLMGYEQQFTKLLPTPTATDYKGGCASRFWTSTHTHTHTHRAGLRRPAEEFSGAHSAWEDWPNEPGIPRVDDWSADRVDRIKCLGNAVVPQQFYPFFAAIAEIEQEGQS